MLISMTGYGKGSAKLAGGTVTAEVRTVNHRFLDFSIRLPRSLNGYEREAEKAARRNFRRGHVYIMVTLDKSVEADSYGLNRSVLVKIRRLLEEFKEGEGIPGTVDINTLLSFPEVFVNDKEVDSPTATWSAVRRALDAAMKSCAGMRRREGKSLEKDMRKRITSLEKAADRIDRKKETALKRSLARARKRLRQLLGNASIDDKRWALEAAIMAERADFTEELVRLMSHLRQFGTVLRRGGEVSKKLNFLLQEIHREATTMGNKAADSSIIRECLVIKEDAEKLREQVQNLE